MKNKFKYDYNNKMFAINIVLSLVFLALSIISFDALIGFILLLIMSIVALFNAFFLMRLQGIRIVKGKYIVIVDQLLYRKLCIANIRYVSLKQIPKETRNRTYGFFHEFFYPHTYLSHCDYVYNQGRVYNICFHMTDGTIVKSYFGWLYREKGKKVEQVEKKLHKFIESINNLCKEHVNSSNK